MVFTCMKKSDVVPKLFHSAYDLRKLMWALVRHNRGEITPLGWKGELFIRVEEEIPILYREKVKANTDATQGGEESGDVHWTLYGHV